MSGTSHISPDNPALTDDGSAAPAHPISNGWFTRTVAALVAGGLLLGHLPLLHKFLVSLAGREQYAFFPLLLIAAAYLAVDRLRGAPATLPRRGTWRVAAPLLLASLLCSALGAIFYVRWLAAPAAWLTLGALAWRLGGRAIAKALWPVGVLLLVIIPPPMHFEDTLTRSLQQLAVRGSSALLDVLRIPHLMSGTVLEIPGHRLMIEEACSGINSLLSVIAFTLLFAFLKRRKPAAVAALVLAAVAFVLWANVVRITLGAVVQQWWGINILAGSAHHFSGFVLFAVCLLLVASADQLLLLMTGADEAQSSAGQLSARQSSTRSAVSAAGIQRPARAAASLPERPSMLWGAIGLAFAIVGIFSFLRIQDCWPAPRLSGSIAIAPPARIAGWELMPGAVSEQAETFGRYVRRWIYRDGSMTAEVSFAYPFVDLRHDASNCYSIAGWRITDRAEHPQLDPQPGPQFNSQLERAVASPARLSAEVPHTELEMTKLATTHGYLLFAAFDEAGRWQVQTNDTPPAGYVAYRIWLARQVAQQPPTHEIQTLVVAPTGLDAMQKAKVDALFETVCTEVSRRALAELGAPSRIASQTGGAP
jgi:exosortase